MARSRLLALSVALLVACARAQAPEPSTDGAADAPIAFAPTSESTASAPNPNASTRVRTGAYASDSLANTSTSYNQIQTIGTYSSAHVAPPAAIQEYLASDAAQSALPTDANSPNSTQWDALQIYNQLETIGARQLHFPIYYDPTGKLYQENAGLKIVNQSGNVSAEDPKWTYPGWKVMNEPDFDWNTSCTTLVTCLFNVKNWLLTTPNPVPLTIYLEPTVYTYTSATGDNATFAEALAASNQTGGPDSLAEPLDIETFEPFFQPWRDLERELMDVFDNNTYFSIVTPDDVMGEEDTLADAVLREGYTLYPALQYLKNRIFFVLTGDYVQNYLEFYPDLVNATLFIAEPYNEAGTYTNSTLFVDVVGPLSGTNATTNFTSNDARTSVATQAQQVTDAVKKGYMVRASADWNTLEPRQNSTYRAQQMLSAGAHFVQTTFPTTPSLFPSTYTVALPIRGNIQQSARCNPVTSGGVIFNATALYTTGCPAINGLTPAQAPSTSDA